MIAALRATLFYTGFILCTAWFGFTGVLVGILLPYRPRSGYILLWNRFILWWLKICCGVSFRVHGLENMPTSPVVVLSKHSSQWETFYLQLAFRPIATIMKEELLRIPAFGWGLRLLKPIAIDRGNPRESMRQMLDQGELRIKDGLSVLVFPEGTRSQGKQPKYARGGAALAIRAGVPIVPVAHNASAHWPPHRFCKIPGIIDVHVGKPIPVQDSNSRELTEQARDWIEEVVAGMAG
jgi:1-acyl-sn-glycerol-3-phosphate acyltransferase